MHGSQGQGKRPDINTETGCSRLVIYPKSIFAEVEVFLTDMDEVYLPDQRSWLDRKEFRKRGVKNGCKERIGW